LRALIRAWGNNGPAVFATLGYPEALTLDAQGNLYIADFAFARVRKVTPAGTITTVAGNGVDGFSGDGGLATSAELSSPTGVAVDSSGNLYISTAPTRGFAASRPRASLLRLLELEIFERHYNARDQSGEQHLHPGKRDRRQGRNLRSRQCRRDHELWPRIQPRAAR